MNQADKTFILSPFTDENYFNKITTSKYHIIDFAGILKNIPVSNNKQVNDFLFEKEITNQLKPVVNNKKFRNLIFIIRTIDPDEARLKIEKLTLQLNPTLNMCFSLVVSKCDLEDYEYDTQKYAYMYIHDED